jgi:uncharacterized protein YkwD
MSWLDRLIAIIHSHSHPVPGPVPPRPPVPPTPGEAAAALLAATNRARQAAGLPALAADPRLNATAQSWAAECARTGVLSHFGPGGSTPWTRIRDAGVGNVNASENIAMGQRTVEEVVRGWLTDPPHAANVLGRAFTHAGHGCAAGKNGQLFWVADYIRISL